MFLHLYYSHEHINDKYNSQKNHDIDQDTTPARAPPNLSLSLYRLSLQRGEVILLTVQHFDPYGHSASYATLSSQVHLGIYMSRLSYRWKCNKTHTHPHTHTPTPTHQAVWQASPPPTHKNRPSVEIAQLQQRNVNICNAQYLGSRATDHCFLPGFGYRALHKFSSVPCRLQQQRDATLQHPRPETAYPPPFTI